MKIFKNRKVIIIVSVVLIAAILASVFMIKRINQKNNVWDTDNDGILEILAIKLLGVIPDDDNIVISTNRGEPTVLDQQSRSGQAYRNIVKRIMGEEVPLMNLDEQEGFFTRLMKLFKGN